MALVNDPTRLRSVTLVSGETIEVQGDAEASWFQSTRDQYLKQNKFTEVTDQQDLDRLLALELMVYRWTKWLAKGVDYDDVLVDEDALQRSLKLYSEQISKLKDQMGLTIKARDDKANKGDVPGYLAELARRAKLFGIHREKQLDKALTLFNELVSVVTTYDRSDAEERQKIGFENDNDVLDWIRKVAIPEFQEIDLHFRQNVQKLWTRM